MSDKIAAIVTIAMLIAIVSLFPVQVIAGVLLVVFLAFLVAFLQG